MVNVAEPSCERPGSRSGRLSGWLRHALGPVAALEPEIPDQPLMNAAASRALEGYLAGCDTYMEYGLGGSTMLAATRCRQIIGVETDRRFVAALRRRLDRPGLARSTLIHADIGPVGWLGMPVDPWPSRRNIRGWANHAQAPWRAARRLGVRPQLVLIDGRFRAASATICLLELVGSADALVLIDDYADRRAYHRLEELGERIAMHGKLAVFRPRPCLPRPIARNFYRSALGDWR